MGVKVIPTLSIVTESVGEHSRSIEQGRSKITIRILKAVYLALIILRISPLYTSTGCGGNRNTCLLIRGSYFRYYCGTRRRILSSERHRFTIVEPGELKTNPRSVDDVSYTQPSGEPEMIPVQLTAISIGNHT